MFKKLFSAPMLVVYGFLIATAIIILIAMQFRPPGLMEYRVAIKAHMDNTEEWDTSALIDMEILRADLQKKGVIRAFEFSVTLPEESRSYEPTFKAMRKLIIASDYRLFCDLEGMSYTVMGDIDFTAPMTMYCWTDKATAAEFDMQLRAIAEGREVDDVEDANQDGTPADPGE